jgi:hypothetical protein
MLADAARTAESGLTHGPGALAAELTVLVVERERRKECDHVHGVNVPADSRTRKLSSVTSTVTTTFLSSVQWGSERPSRDDPAVGPEPLSGRRDSLIALTSGTRSNTGLNHRATSLSPSIRSAASASSIRQGRSVSLSVSSTSVNRWSPPPNPNHPATTMAQRSTASPARRLIWTRRSKSARIGGARTAVRPAG